MYNSLYTLSDDTQSSLLPDRDIGDLILSPALRTADDSLPLVTASQLPPSQSLLQKYDQALQQLIVVNAKNAKLELENKQLRNDIQAFHIRQAAGVDDTVHSKCTQTDKALQESVDKTDGKDLETALFRSDGNLSVLSNFYSTKLRYRGTSFTSAEHAYQHSMALFHSRPDVAYRILTAHTPAQAKRFSKVIKQCEQWHEAKPAIMSEILLAKANQCLAFKEKLLETDNKKLIHNIDTDSYWGCGRDLQGTNMMGKLLEELRCNI
jgi:ribA/ribD-fused uncharacterized protein